MMTEIKRRVPLSEKYAAYAINDLTQPKGCKGTIFDRWAFQAMIEEETGEGLGRAVAGRFLKDTLEGKFPDRASQWMELLKKASNLSNLPIPEELIPNDLKSGIR